MPATAMRLAGWSPIFPQFMLFPRREPRCLGFLRRLLKRDDLVLYWHRLTKNWVVAVPEFRRGQPGVSEIKVICHSPGHGPPAPDADALNSLVERAFSWTDPRAAAAELDARERHDDEEDDAQLREDVSKQDWLWKRLGVAEQYYITGKELARREA